MIRFVLSVALGLAASPISADVPRVVTDIAPVQSIVARVMQGVGAPTVILPAGASPHEHALRPSEARSLSEAEIVIWVGPNLTQWLEDSIGTLAPEAVQLVLSEVNSVNLLPFREGGAFGEHDDNHDDHADEGFDPHLWLDPENGVVWMEAIAAALSDFDPQNAASYAANAEAGAAEIREEAERIQTLTGEAPRSYLAYHDAFQYVEGWLGLVGVGAIQSGHAVEPGPARLAELRDEIASLGVTCVLAEPQFNAGLVDAVVGAGQGRIVPLDPLGSAFEEGPSQYLSILGQFAQVPLICD